MSRSFLALACLLAAPAAFADGATTETVAVDDIQCSSVVRPNGSVLEHCEWFSGVRHVTVTPSGNIVSVFQGDNGWSNTLNGVLVAGRDRQGHQIILQSVDEYGDTSLITNHTDLCSEFTDRGVTTTVETSVQFAGGEIILEEVTVTDGATCD